MLEDYFSYRGVLLRGGALGAEMDRIAEYFSSRGYKRASAKLYLSRIARFKAWLGRAQVATTHRYAAAADVEMMRRGLEKAGVSGDRSARFRPNDAVLQLLDSI